MRFLVKFRSGESASSNRYPQVVLEQDNWDDYGYKTTFHVVVRMNKDSEVQLGNVRILKFDQKSGYTPVPKRPFSELGDQFCSLGESLNYYETLFGFGRAFYTEYLQALGDVAFDDEIRAKFEDLEGFEVSLLRFSGAKRTITDAASLFQTKKKIPRRRGQGFVLKFKTKISSSADSFTSTFDFRRKARLPNRINAIIGYNGTGKTRLLSNLAIVASGYGYANKKDMVEEQAGRFIGTPPPIKTVIVISYSAFDSFVIPGRNEVERARLRDLGEIFGYVYCGLRIQEKGGTYKLQSQKETKADFIAAWQRILSSDRWDAFTDTLQPLFAESSFRRAGLTTFHQDQDIDLLAELFERLSSGHKMVLKIVAELVAHIDDEQPSLVLIDEPETHLHPPLLAAFLRSIRICLDQFDGYSIISTHSPVVLQETASRFVHVLRRLPMGSSITPPTIETFGENVGVITQEVFNLDDASTNFYSTLDYLAQTYSKEEIADLFDNKLGFSARSYIESARSGLE